MICRLCEDAVCHRLLYTRGVYEVQASWFHNRVTVIYETDLVNTETINQVLRDAGYPPAYHAHSSFIAILISLALVPVFWYLFDLLAAVRIPGMENISAVSPGTCLYLFMVGLLTGAHCIAMCGGIVLALQKENRKKTCHSVFVYQVGRILGCVGIGMICGALGHAFSFQEKTGSMILTMTGCFILLLALISLGMLPGIRRFSDLWPHSFSHKAFSSLHEKKERFGGSFLTGLFNAFLPCGASYAMWAAAAASGHLLSGLWIALSWSLGTAVLLFLFGVSGSFGKGRTALWTNRISAEMLAVLAVRMIVSGLGLI